MSLPKTKRKYVPDASAGRTQPSRKKKPPKQVAQPVVALAQTSDSKNQAPDETGSKASKPKSPLDDLNVTNKTRAEPRGAESCEGGERINKKVLGEKRPCCFLDISIEGANAGRIVIELFKDALPKTCDNFRALCTGEKSTVTDKLHYKGSVIHRITPNFVLQGGDFDNGDGTGGRSIYGAPFEDEGFVYRHVKPGAVAMANKGKDGNTSQFYITLDKAPLKYLDKTHVVFGRVIVGMAVVRSIERVGTPEGVPKAKVMITDCGRFKLKTERKKLATTTRPLAPKPSCPKCSGGLKYIKRLPQKNLVRFWCKNKACGGAVNLPHISQNSSG